MILRDVSLYRWQGLLLLFPLCLLSGGCSGTHSAPAQAGTHTLLFYSSLLFAVCLFFSYRNIIRIRNGKSSYGRLTTDTYTEYNSFKIIHKGDSMKINRQGKAATLNASEEATILSRMIGRHALRDRAMFLICLYTGMRRNEARSLNIRDLVDEDGGIRPRFSLRAEITKTKKARDVYVMMKPAQAIAEYLAFRLGVGDRLDPDSPLFISQYGQRVALSTFSRVFEVAFQQAKILGASTHSMRRTFVTRLHENNTPVKVISHMVGHSNIATTSGYIDINERQIEEALKSLRRG
jgi:integrase/recombinase XerD